MTKKITILETGELPDELKARYDSYTPMFEALIGDKDFRFETVHVSSGATLPDPRASDGYVITGSRHGVYDDLPWIEPLKAFLRQAASAQKRIVGICFGHQILAEAMGGKVMKSPKGWGLGPMEYKALPEAKRLGNTPDKLDIIAVHQDQIVEKPKDAEVFASSDFCEFAGLVYGDGKPYAMSLQPHPEFTPEFTEDLIEFRRGTAFPEEQSGEAIAALNQRLNSMEWGRVIIDFLKDA